jgi:hypothetical protein
VFATTRNAALAFMVREMKNIASWVHMHLVGFSDGKHVVNSDALKLKYVLVYRSILIYLPFILHKSIK